MRPPHFPAASFVCEVRHRERWLEDRRSGVSASDSPILLLGTHYGRTPLWLFQDKLGLLPEDNGGMTEHQEMGLSMEPVAFSRLAAEIGTAVEEVGALYRSTAWPFLLATPDGVTTSGALVEVKTQGIAADWSDGVPEKFRIQAQHQMAVTGARRCYVAAILGGFGGLEFKYGVVEYDEAFVLETLVPACEAFWRHVDQREPPPAGQADGTIDLVRAYGAPTEDVALHLDEASWLEQDRRLMDAKERKKQAEAEAKEIENLVKETMLRHKASSAYLADGTRYRLIPAKSGSFRLDRKEGNR